MRTLNDNFSFIFFLVLVGIVLSSFSLPVFGAIPPQERAVLITLYNSTDGDNWWDNSGWKTPPLASDGFALTGTENTWRGITCDPGNTTVQSIDLRINNLNGPLPPELGNLANLQYLSLSVNQLSGAIPLELGNLANLQYLSLSSNQFSGAIPPELGNLANLQDLSLSSTQLSGAIPPELGNLANLQYLRLSSNQLSGAIPPELGSLANLQYLYLDLNQLSGSIPLELGNLANLAHLYLHSNQLSGSIPAELGNLANLQDLDLAANYLSGSIPAELGNLANLQYLSLSGNQLSGAIPPELGNLANLQYLNLSSNQLSGAIPLELGNLANLQYLYINSNQLSGTIPAELGNLAKLLRLNITYNQLSGSIPAELGSLANLRYLYLYYNQLSGSIPAELGNLVNLRYLYLHNNQLSGSIPPELGNLAKLIGLVLRYNQLSGSIPPELGNLGNLNDLNLYRNYLSGSIPAELGNLANLRYLDLHYNQLSGGIPAELGNLDSLLSLALSSNMLSGSIPFNLINLTNLYNGSLDLKWNALYTNDDTLRAFLDSKQYGGNWQDTQTIAPVDVTAAAVSTSSIDINWTPISYTDDTGGYRIFYSATSGGPYTYFDMTANKTEPSTTVTGLNPGTTYYLVVQTRTNPHFNNQNTVDSEYSSEVSTSIPQGITIAGTVTNDGSGLTGVTITLSAEGGTATTDTNGYYSVVVPYGWTGTVTPSKAGYSFSPPTRSYSDVAENQTNQDYTAVLQGVTVSGTVTSGSSGLQGVTITLSAGGGTATTDANGNYTITVSYGWTGTATPSKSGYNFSPANRSYTDVTEDQSNQNYTAALQTITIAGTVTNDGSGLTGVTITLSNSGGTAATDANGNYTITASYGWTGTATPSKPGYNFSTTNRSYSNVTVNQTNQDYTAVLQGVAISGTVTSDNSGLPGVVISLSNGGGTATTDANGNYTITVSYGWTGTVTPSKPGYNFSPTNRDYTNVTVNQTNQNFLGNPLTHLSLTSPNGGESWGFGTIRNITWTSSGLSGNIRLELWKANKKLYNIAANIPIANGNYAWIVGIYSRETIPPGNNYMVKIITANGLYSDTSDRSFSIVKPSITLTSPRNGEKWKLGTQQNITWTSVGLTDNVNLILLKDGVKVGTIAQGIPVANGTYAWTVGSHSNGMVSAGRNYTVKICSEYSRFRDSNGSFRITD